MEQMLEGYMLVEQSYKRGKSGDFKEDKLGNWTPHGLQQVERTNVYKLLNGARQKVRALLLNPGTGYNEGDIQIVYFHLLDEKGNYARSAQEEEK